MPHEQDPSTVPRAGPSASSHRDHTQSAGWLKSLTLGFVVAAAFVLLPRGVVHRLLLTPGSLVTAIAIVVAIRRYRPAPVAPWSLLAASMLVYFPASIVFNFAYTFPSPGDAVFFIAYGLQITALVAFVRHRLRRTETGWWLEVAILVSSVALVSYVFFLRPFSGNAALPVIELLAAFGYPVMDMLLLVGATILAVTPGSRGASFWLLLTSVIVQLTADLFYAYAAYGGWYEYDANFVAGYFIAWGCLGASALHPSMRYLARAGADEDLARVISPLRVPMLGIAALTPSLISLVGYLSGTDLPMGLVSAVSVAVIGLVTVRVSMITKEATDQRTALQEANIELRQSEAEVRAAIAEAERANAAKSEFLSRMSHELRTPLNAILGFSQLLKMDDLDDSQRESVSQIASAGTHLLELINDVLDIARIESGEVGLTLEPVRLDEIVDESVQLVAPSAARRDIVITTERTGRGTAVLADKRLLKQIVINLLSNAVKYNRESGAVTTRVAVTDTTVRLSVRDTGPGIEREKVDRLFQAFDRLGAEKSGVEGTGLGLVISQTLATAMGGRLEVDSEVGAGSTFSLTLQRTHVPTENTPKVAAPRPETAPQHADTLGTVLYVEDNASNVQLVQRVLQRRPGIDLIVASDASTGIAEACRVLPDLILLDLNLPDASGRDVLRHLRDREAMRSTPVVMVTADASKGLAEALIQDGASGYITKPIEISALLGTVDRHLQSKAEA